MTLFRLFIKINYEKSRQNHCCNPENLFLKISISKIMWHVIDLDHGVRKKE